METALTEPNIHTSGGKLDLPLFVMTGPLLLMTVYIVAGH